MTDTESRGLALARRPQGQDLRAGVLGFPTLLAQSIALISPTMTAALIVPLTYSDAGNGTWIAYLFATIMLSFVVMQLNEFARRSASAGSMYAYTGRGLGPRRVFGGLVVELAPTRHAQHDDAGAVGRGVGGPLRFEGCEGDLVSGFGVVVGLGKPMSQHGVDPGTDVGSRAAVDGQLLTPGVSRQQAGEQLDIGMAKPIDRLLRIADGKHRRWRTGCIGRCQLGEDVELHLIGVLELVDEQVAMPSTDGGAHIRPGLEHAPGQHEQIVERQLTATDAVARRGSTPARSGCDRSRAPRLLLGRIAVLPLVAGRSIGKARLELAREPSFKGGQVGRRTLGRRGLFIKLGEDRRETLPPLHFRGTLLTGRRASCHGCRSGLLDRSWRRLLVTETRRLLLRPIVVTARLDNILLAGGVCMIPFGVRRSTEAIF